MVDYYNDEQKSTQLNVSMFYNNKNEEDKPMFKIIYVAIDPEAGPLEENYLQPEMLDMSFDSLESALNYLRNEEPNRLREELAYGIGEKAAEETTFEIHEYNDGVNVSIDEIGRFEALHGAELNFGRYNYTIVEIKA